MLKIRLARAGAKKRPYYKIVVADIRAPRDGRFIEKVGSYNPILPKDSDERVQLVTDRIKYWLSQGAQPTRRVAIFLGKAGIIEVPKYENPEKAKPKAKAQELLKEKAEKAKAAEEAKAAEAEAPAEEAAAEEAPAEEAAAEEAPAEEKAEEKAEDAPAEEEKAEEKAEEAPAEEAKEEEKKDA